MSLLTLSLVNLLPVATSVVDHFNEMVHFCLQSNRMLSCFCVMCSTSAAFPVMWSLSRDPHLHQCSGWILWAAWGHSKRCPHPVQRSKWTQEPGDGSSSAVPEPLLVTTDAIGGVCPQYVTQLCEGPLPFPVYIQLPTTTLSHLRKGGCLSIRSSLCLPMSSWAQAHSTLLHSVNCDAASDNWRCNPAFMIHSSIHFWCFVQFCYCCIYLQLCVHLFALTLLY